MEAAIGIGTLIVLMIVGVPIAFSFAGMTVVLCLLADVNMASLMITGFWSMNSVVLIALPLFILTGYLMQSGGLADRLIDFIESIIGRVRGGLGVALILSSAIFGAISGTASAAVASIGKVMIRPMEKRGYARRYSTALLGISSLLVFDTAKHHHDLIRRGHQAIGCACFAASIGPGILLIIGLSVANRFLYGRYRPAEKPIIFFQKKSSLNLKNRVPEPFRH